jgi:hypothetical protein
VRSVGWLTSLDAGFVAEIGGADVLTRLGFEVSQTPTGGVIFQMSPKPALLGPGDAGLKPYQTARAARAPLLDRALARLRTHRRRWTRIDPWHELDVVAEASVSIGADNFGKIGPSDAPKITKTLATQLARVDAALESAKADRAVRSKIALKALTWVREHLSEEVVRGCHHTKDAKALAFLEACFSEKHVPALAIELIRRQLAGKQHKAALVTASAALKESPGHGTLVHAAASAAHESGDVTLALERIAHAARLGYDTDRIKHDPVFSKSRRTSAFRQALASR